MGVCITCDKMLPMSQAHAGHFQSRRYNSTRWNEENVNLQCAGCNTFRHGEQYMYGVGIDKKYGNGTSKKLAKLAQEYFKVTTEYLEEVIADSKEAILFYETTTNH